MGRPRQNFKFNLPEKWDDITLQKFIELQSLYKDEHKPTYIEIISVLSNISEQELREYPALVIDKVMDNLKFLSEPITKESLNTIDIDGERYIINYMEELKFGEFVDVQTVLDADKDNFPAILSIICRKEGEIYNDEYIAKLQPKRMEMFAKQPVTKVYPIIFGEPQRASKPHSDSLRKFSKKWNWIKTLYELSNEEIEKVEKTAQQYLTTVLQFLTYTIEKGWAEEDEDKFQSELQKRRRN